MVEKNAGKEQENLFKKGKRMITYKIIKYTCGCKYITTFINHYQCPVHKRMKAEVTLFCISCGHPVTRKNIRAAARQRYCFDCADIRRRAQNREGWLTKYRGRYVKDQKYEYTGKESRGEKDKRQLEEWYKSCFKPLPRVETPILERWMNESP